MENTHTIFFNGGLDMAGKISSKQQEILEYIKEQILKKGYPPAVREICDAVHLKSTSSVFAHFFCNGGTYIISIGFLFTFFTI